MLGLSKFIPRQLSIVSQCFSVTFKTQGQRNMFAPTYYGLDKFIKHAQYIERQHGKNSESIRSTIQQALERPDSKIFTEDLKVLLYLTKSDADFQLLLKAINKYQSQESLPIFNFRFGAPLMRLTSILNKTNEALDIYLKNEHTFLHDSFSTGFILMNKLFEEKRYDDVIKVFHKLLSLRNSINEKSNRTTGQNSKFFPNDILKVVGETLLEKNDDDALRQALELFQFIKDENLEIGNKSLAALFLLAIQRNNPEFAYELSAKEVKNRTPVNQNFKIIALVHLNRTQEALSAAKSLLQARSQPNLRLFFSNTLESLKEGVKKSNNSEFQRELDEIISKASSENLVMNLDLKEYATRLVEYKLSAGGGQQQQQSGDGRPQYKRNPRSNENEQSRPYFRNRSPQYNFRDNHLNRTDRPDRPDRAERSDRGDRPDRAERSDRPERTERYERNDRPDRQQFRQQSEDRQYDRRNNESKYVSRRNQTQNNE